MPFLLLDDATQEAQRRLQGFGDALLQANQPPFAPGGPGTQAVQDATQRLQDFGTQQLQSLQPQQPPQQVQMLDQGGGLQDITQRLQDFGSQQLQNATQAQQNLVQQLEPLNQPPFQQQSQQVQDLLQPGGPEVPRGGDLQAYARQAAQRNGIDPDIFTAQIQQESGFNPTAQSPAGAIGIAQFMPGTAQGMGIDPTDPYAALDAAAKMDAQHLAQYGGDWSKTLAAYNAGPGAVAQYGGVPPFAETQRYVQSILGNAKNAAGQAVSAVQQGAQNVAQGAQQAVSNALPAISQFGDKQLSAAEAYAACGPAAAVRFAQMFGRQPTLREAVDLASQVGWTAAGGMAGLGSESALFDKMNIPHRMVGADWNALAREAQSGNPVTISTPGHYFTADGYDPSTGAFHVGSSGTDLRGGSEWMTPDQMQARMGQLQGGMAVDNPQVPGPSPLSQGTSAARSAVSAVQQGVQDLGQAATQKAQNAWQLLNDAMPTAADLATGGITRRFNENLQGAAQDVTGALAGLPSRQDIGQAVENLPTGNVPLLSGVAGVGTGVLGGLLQAPSILDQMQTIQDLTDKYADTPGSGTVTGANGQRLTVGVDPAVMTPEDRAAYNQAMFAIGGMEMPEQPGRMSVPSLVSAIQQYPEEVQQGLRDFVQAQTQAGVSGREINDTLRQFVADNPVRPPTPAAATTLEPEVAATLRPGTGPLAPPAAEQPATDVLTGLQNMARGRNGETTLTSGEAPTPPAPPAEPTGPTPPAPTQPGLVGRILGAPGAAASRFGSLVASALGPVENLPTDTAGVLKNYANMVGRQSDAARVMAENQMRTAGARLDIPAVQEQVTQVRGELRDQAARTLVENLQAQGKAAPVGSAPREFRSVTDNPNTYLSNYVFSPDVVAPIKAVTDMSDIAANPLGSTILKTIGTAKGTLFSLSNFHTLTEGLNAAFTSPQTGKNYLQALLSDSFAQGLRGTMADIFDAAARAGVTGLAEHARPEDVGTQFASALGRRLVAAGVGGVGGAGAGYTETKLTGGSDEEAWANAAKGAALGATLSGVPLGSRGTVPEILQSALWDRAVPLAKATAWDGMVKGGMDPQQAANVVNERFGGLNYAAMGRNATMLDAQRLTLMASDWNEATVRQLGSAIFGGDGSGVRRGFLLKTLAGMMGVTEALNIGLTGHSTLDNQPGHQFEVEMQDPNGGTMHFGVLPGNIQAYLNLADTMVTDAKKRETAPTNFIVNRLSAPVGTGIDLALAAAGKPPFQMAKAGAIPALAENVSPIGVSQAMQSVLHGGLNPVVAGALAAGGLNPRYSVGGTAVGDFTAPTTRAPLPTRSAGAGSSGARAPVPKR